MSNVISAAIFILLEVAAIGMLSRSAKLQDIWINSIAYKAKAIFLKPFISIHNFASLRIQNEILSQENDELLRQLLACRAQLDAIVCDSSFIEAPVGFSYIPAQIIRLSTNNQRNFFILNKGAEDGVTPQSGVISGNGVIGVVKIVDKKFSYGFTIMNPEINVSVRTQKDSIIAPLSWSGVEKNKMQIKDIPVHTAISEGDTVVTSGLSAIFPRDIPIGITEKTTLVGGSSCVVDVKLFQNFRKLRYVAIVKNIDYDTIAELEKEQ